MTHFVANMTLDSAKYGVMQGASCAQRKVSMVPFVLSIPFVLSRGGSISPDSFLLSILLLVVIIVTVVIEQADKIAWSELKRLLTNKYCPRIEVKKMEEEFYNLVVKGNDLKTYARRFQELAVLCPNMIPNTEKRMEVFIGGLPRSIKGNVTTSKPQTLEEAINIT
uniref:Reverse transcriptase domain-containing protein n=1 Tax=Tanacetum cinerariifolium TaxID=118510 RepID=A0A699HNZ8_TANCI|nr:reverse transcriptase domain-containing protein [Tanacetum cinerariifolium]